MTAATVTINGHKLGEYRGGYTPFSFDLTPHLKPDGHNVLAVEVDSTERPDIPPFGGNIDYLTFGGIYREVALRVVPQVFIGKRFRQTGGCSERWPPRGGEVPAQRQAGRRGLADFESGIAGRRTVRCLRRPRRSRFRRATADSFESRRGRSVGPRSPEALPSRAPLPGPKVIDEYATRIGFREARFTPQGFMLNGKHSSFAG